MNTNLGFRALLNRLPKELYGSLSALSEKQEEVQKMAQFCSKCGNEIEPGAKFCGECGNALETNVSSKSE